ncbi:hypothetical protein [Acidisarcina polymorpha]|nr:hypothetical protein [Acidisarcina polymorpha]
MVPLGTTTSGSPFFFARHSLLFPLSFWLRFKLAPYLPRDASSLHDVRLSQLGIAFRHLDVGKMLIAALSMRESKLGVTREPSIREAIVDFERRKTPPAAQFVYVTSR